MYYNFYKIIKYLYIIARFAFSVNYTYLLELTLMGLPWLALNTSQEKVKGPSITPIVY